MTKETLNRVREREEKIKAAKTEQEREGERSHASSLSRISVLQVIARISWGRGGAGQERVGEGTCTEGGCDVSGGFELKQSIQ